MTPPISPPAPLPACATDAATASELAALRARVAELEARLATRSSPSAPTASNAEASARAVPIPGFLGTPLPALPPARTIITQDGTTLRVIPLPPEAEEPFGSTGCSRGFLKGPPPGKWRDADAWDGLVRGLTPAEVEGLLGVEHHDKGSPARQLWEYGKCNGTPAGTVLFVAGRVEGWRAPENLR